MNQHLSEGRLAIQNFVSDADAQLKSMLLLSRRIIYHVVGTFVAFMGIR